MLHKLAKLLCSTAKAKRLFVSPIKTTNQTENQTKTLFRLEAAVSKLQSVAVSSQQHTQSGQMFPPCVHHNKRRTIIKTPQYANHDRTRNNKPRTGAFKLHTNTNALPRPSQVFSRGINLLKLARRGLQKIRSGITAAKM